jgi:hypothetical protein
MVKSKSLLRAGSLLGLLFHPEDGGVIFLGNSDIKPCSVVKSKKDHASCWFLFGSMLGFLFDLEDGGDIVLRNFSPDYTALYPRLCTSS